MRSAPLSVETLYQCYGDFVYRVCFRYTKTQEEAEDMAQDVFIRAGRNLNEFRGEASPSTWLYRLSINSCIDYLRWKKRQNELAMLYLDEQVERNLGGHGEAVAAKIDLEKLLEPLDPGVRQMVFMHFAEGLDYNEIGAVLGVSPGAVANKILRFRKKIRTTRRRELGALARALLRFSNSPILLMFALFAKGGA